MFEIGDIVLTRKHQEQGVIVRKGPPFDYWVKFPAQDVPEPFKESDLQSKDA